MKRALPSVLVAGCALLLTASRAQSADSDSLLGVHFWGILSDTAPATLLDSQARGGYDLEIVNTGNPEWNDVDVVQPLYDNFKNSYNITPITRLGYYWGKTLPAPGSAEYNNWPTTIANNVVARLKNTAHLWQMGNECNLNGEATNWTNQQITPAAYATLYHSVRTAIKAPALVGTAGAHQLLVAPPSPGGAVSGVRWIDGSQWLDQTLAAIPAGEVDGVALHAYGGGTARQSLQGFRSSLLDQVKVVDNRGLTQVPLYLTEWNRASQIGNLADEAVSAAFARQALSFMNRWNRTPGNHNIVANTWFVYDGGDGSGAWDTYSIEYWKNHGNPTNSTSSLYNAFYTAARAGYKAGISGTRPIPAGVTILDDFETDEGHFAGANFQNQAGSSGLASASCFKVRQSDADSYSKLGAEKIGIADDSSNASGWYLRFLSGNGNAASNTPISLTGGTDGSIGFFARLYTVNGNEDVSAATGQMTIQLVLDTDGGGGINSDAGKPLSIIADGDWHLYEWNLDNPGDWVPWSVVSTSDGKIGTNGLGNSGTVTIDSICIQGGNFNVEMLLDTVGRNSAGSFNVMQSLPEPSSLALIGSALALLMRRPRTHPRPV